MAFDSIVFHGVHSLFWVGRRPGFCPVARGGCSAVAAARQIHLATPSPAENVFLFWGLVHRVPPPSNFECFGTGAAVFAK